MKHPPSATPALELTEVSKVFSGPVQVQAVRNVSLSIGQDDVLAVVGPTGSGKSTLLAILGTLERPTSGSVRLAGSDLAAMSDRSLSRLRAEQIGFVFQGFNLLPHLSALENVEEALVYTGCPRRERRQRAALALAAVELTDRQDHLPTQLSGGEQQRVAIARALVTDPMVVLADEPTGNLDHAAAELVLQLLIGREGLSRSVVIVTHNESIAERMPRVIRLNSGTVVGDTRT
jgi:putative ABC transport system ATP-binding protein